MTRANNAGTLPLAVVILAAGRGKRFPGVPSKVLVSLGGRPLVVRVLETVRELGPARVVVVVGHGAEHVRAALAGHAVEFALQGEPRGTGHAVLAAGALLGLAPSEVLVLNGDVPLLRAETLRRLLKVRRKHDAGCALVSAVVPDAGAYGRIVRRLDGSVGGIVEAADAPRELLAVREINVGAYVFRSPELLEILALTGDRNAQGEIYLTDAVNRLAEQGSPIAALILDDAAEGLGVNSPEELEELERALMARG